MSSESKWPTCNAWWAGSCSSFLSSTIDDVVGQLASRASARNLPPTPETLYSWRESYGIVYSAIVDAVAVAPELLKLGVLFEYEIPRRSSRPDVIILSRDRALVIEFKVGAQTFPRAAQIQVADYVLDLLDYHSASHSMTVIPALVATGSGVSSLAPDPLRGKLAIRNTSGSDVSKLLIESFSDETMPSEDEIFAWVNSQYRPTPGILESAREVFAGNEVAEIKHAYADNLDVTVDAIQDVITRSRIGNRRSICFITGVPGSGKTLTGLSAIHEFASGQSETIGAYLSGNAPLVQVLRYAIAKDRHNRDSNISMNQALSESTTLIQHIRDFFHSEYSRNEAPTENVIVFDEAQRAWNANQMATSGKLKILRSQADLALEIMSRCPSWSVIIAIVGEGQEINQGEAGISEWFNALQNYPEWEIAASNQITEEIPPSLVSRLDLNNAFHLKVGTRSPRAKNIAIWAQQVLDGDFGLAGLTANLIKDFPMFITRDLEIAKNFLRDCSSEDRRVGMLASSQDRRLRAYGIERSTNFLRSIRWPEWFVESADDVRSSYTLEVAASEFECQGLEIDWTLVCWGSDLLWTGNKWQSKKFVGTKWQNDKNIDFAINRYRVLLTRARQGMVVWVPSNKDSKIPFVDNTALDAMADILVTSGFRELPM